MKKSEGSQTIEEDLGEISKETPEEKSVDVKLDPEYQKIQDQVISELVAGSIEDPKELAVKVVAETQKRYDALKQNKEGAPSDAGSKPEELEEKEISTEPIKDDQEKRQPITEEITTPEISPEPAPVVEKTEINPKEPETQPKEAPVDLSPDLKDAKDRLAKLYGSGTEIVGAENLGEIAKTEAIADQIKPTEPNIIIDVDKSISIPVPRKESSLASEQPAEETPEQRLKQIQERLSVSEESRTRQSEGAKIQLEEELRAIEMARQTKDKAKEAALYKKIEALFEAAEGRNLKAEAIKKADAQLSEEGLVRMSSNRYREKFSKRAEDLMEQRKRSNILANRFALLPVGEKAKYVDKDGNIDTNKFNVEMDARITAKMDELNKKGFSLTKNIFYAMMERGLKPEEIKVTGIFSKKIEIPQMPFFNVKVDSQKFSIKQFTELVSIVGNGFSRAVKNEASAMVEWEIKRGKYAWQARKQKGMRDAARDAVEGYKKHQEEIRHQEEVEQQKRLQ